ncbi:MAG TPA: hypothetical protein VNV87_13890 [Acidimicrobiales bacterium]|jgi:hypothetical protein|nr:hypothetical protein [Acidimicrobiales bacterium]
MSEASQRGHLRFGLKKAALLATIAFSGAALLAPVSSAAGASTPAKTVCKNAIASHKTLTANQIKACKAAKIAVPTNPTTTTSTTTAGRQVKGTQVTLGAGTFAGGQDVAVGLYDVTPAAGESGNFSTTGPDSYNEILGGDSSLGGVPSVRVMISKGDQISISGLSGVTFTPVTAPLSTSHSTTTLSAGTWTVGQDIGAGRYVATPGAGQSGNFSTSGNSDYNEILGGDSSSGGVPSVTVSLSKGDVISISGLSQVVMTAE